MSEYGRVVSVNNNEEGTGTTSAVIEVLSNGIITDKIKNNTHEKLNIGDTVRVNAVNNNWNNAYINVKCGTSN